MKLGEEFKPSPNLLNYGYAVGALVALVFAPVYLMGFLSGAPILSYLFFVPTAPLVIYFFLWVRAFYNTLSYKIDKNEVTWRGGVFFKKTSIVPYAKITNIDITQGPIEKLFGISTLRLQTAGYSGPHTSAEIRLAGIENPEEPRKLIVKFMGKK